MRFGATNARIRPLSTKYAEMAERSNAAVLKTVEVKASRGSNPFLCANKSGVRKFAHAASAYMRLFIIELRLYLFLISSILPSAK